MITSVQWDINSLEFSQTTTRGRLTNSRESISHRTHVIIVYPILKYYSEMTILLNSIQQEMTLSRVIQNPNLFISGSSDLSL